MPSLVDQICTPDARLDVDSFHALVRTGKVLERVRRTGQPKVLRLERPPGERLIFKLWHPKQELSSEAIVHYATRFRRNAARLLANGVIAPDLHGWGSVAGARIRFVCYPEIVGQPLKERIPDVDLEAAGAFVARLHAAGIDFRGLHLGNMLCCGDGRYALIDVSDCTFPWRLSGRRRLRRLGAFCGHRGERQFFLADGNWRRFVHAYCRAAGLAPEEALEHVERHLHSLVTPA
ncbi:MAG: hypothetical protein AB7I04_12115 [Pseudomonadales bacterium]